MIKSSTYKKKGEQLFLKGKYQEAIKDFDMAIQLDPTISDYWELRGRCKYYLDQYEEAIKDLYIAIKLDPEKVLILK